MTPPHLPVAGGSDGRTLHLRDLLPLHGKAFVDACYHDLLLRNPTAEELASGLDHLAHGRAKTAIVGRVRYSQEGRERAIRIRGLAFPYALELLGEVPVLGRAIRWAVAAAAIARTRENARRLEDFAVRLEERHSEKLNSLATENADLKAVVERQRDILDAASRQSAADCQAIRTRIQSLSALQRADVVQVTSLLADLEARLGAIEALLKSPRAPGSE